MSGRCRAADFAAPAGLPVVRACGRGAGFGAVAAYFAPAVLAGAPRAGCFFATTLLGAALFGAATFGAATFGAATFGAATFGAVVFGAAFTAGLVPADFAVARVGAAPFAAVDPPAALGADLLAGGAAAGRRLGVFGAVAFDAGVFAEGALERVLERELARGDCCTRVMSPPFDGSSLATGSAWPPIRHACLMAGTLMVHAK